MDIEWTEVLTGEILAFGLIGKALYVYPERTWIQSLIEQDIFCEAPFAADQPNMARALDLLQGWTKQNSGGLTDETFDDIRADYTRLFIGPGLVLAPPWESVHFSEERLTFQEETLQVRAWYQRFGLAAEKLYAEPDDHIGLELEFMAHLSGLALAAQQAGDSPEFGRILAAQRSFLAEHPLRWAPAWCTTVHEQATTDFYRGIALLTGAVITQAAQMLDVTVPPERTR